jgi:hypothetical protein
MFGNRDAIDECKKTPGCPFISWRFESTTKLGPDEYSGHNVGVASRGQIEEAMADAVLQAEGKTLSKAQKKRTSRNASTSPACGTRSRRGDR